MKILTAIPCLYNATTCKKAIESVVNESDVLLIDNGADLDVKEVLNEFYKRPNVFLIKNEVNLYVNKSWNQSMHFFLQWEYEQLVILNSDLILAPGWSDYIIDGISAVPCDSETKEDKIVTEGTAGIAIHLNREMVKLVYPIPNEIKCWFGDFFIYNILRNLGYKTVVKAGYICNHFHNGSQTIAILPNKSEIIEADKVAWVEIVEPLMWERINKLKNGNV